ncbi:MAG: ATP-binding protein [Candidatus Rickettsiella isopodorum]
MGLSLVKESLEQLGGSIKVTSQEGKGSCFTITLDVL